MSSLDEVLSASAELLDELNPIIDSVQNPWGQCQADWIWFRMHSVVVFLRDRGGGPVAAVLARGLLEQAAYWDWALATGVGDDWVPRQAAFELDRLKQLADSIDDTVWTGWLLPPGTSVDTTSTDGIPRSAAEAVKRLRSGDAVPCLEPLKFDGLYSLYKLLEVLAHGGFAAAYTLLPGGGEELSEPLAAAVAHVAVSGGTAAMIAQLNLSQLQQERLIELSSNVAISASSVHGLTLGKSNFRRSPPKTGNITPFSLSSDIERMPAAPESLSEIAESFVDCATNLTHFATNRVRTNDDGASFTWPAFQIAWAQLIVLREVLRGSLGRALLPFAARPLYEEGARWGWMAISLERGSTPGVNLQSIVHDSGQRIAKVRNSLAGDDVPRDTIDHLLGPAIQLLEIEEPLTQLPRLEEMLATAHSSPYGIDSANPIYGVLSQFVHSTPIAALHLQRDQFHSISAPMYAVAVEAACRGFWRTANSTLSICCESDEELDMARQQLTEALAEVIREAGLWHCIG